MKFHFNNCKISGVLSVFPEMLVRFEDEVIDPNDSKSRRLKNIIGFGTRYRAKGTTTMSDMILYGMNELISSEKIHKEDIGAIICVTLCPDYYLPQISQIVQGELGMSHDVYCVDIPQACSGFVVGLIQSFMLLEHMQGKKVVLCTGEIFNRKSKDEPKTESPSFGGDVANITIVENANEGYNDDIYAEMKNDGENRNALLIEYGACRNPMTSEMIDNKKSNIPCSGVDMDGSGVFNFVQREVPPMIKEISTDAKKKIDDFDYFLFHQPNKFMLQKLATALGVQFAKMPMNITTEYGNSDSGTIPVAMTEYASEDLMKKENLCCLSGFGGGLTWCAIVMNIGKLDFCYSVVSDL